MSSIRVKVHFSFVSLPEESTANIIISVLNFLEEISEFVPEIRNVVGLYDKHNTNANAISISGKTLAEIRGF
mgnify:CR=1 FL=1